MDAYVCVCMWERERGERERKRERLRGRKRERQREGGVEKDEWCKIIFANIMMSHASMEDPSPFYFNFQHLKSRTNIKLKGKDAEKFKTQRKRNRMFFEQMWLNSF